MKGCAMCSVYKDEEGDIICLEALQNYEQQIEEEDVVCFQALENYDQDIEDANNFIDEYQLQEFSEKWRVSGFEDGFDIVDLDSDSDIMSDADVQSFEAVSLLSGQFPENIGQQENEVLAIMPAGNNCSPVFDLFEERSTHLLTQNIISLGSTPSEDVTGSNRDVVDQEEELVEETQEELSSGSREPEKRGPTMELLSSEESIHGWTEIPIQSEDSDEPVIQPTPPPPEFRCEFCKLSFTRIDNMRRHERKCQESTTSTGKSTSRKRKRLSLPTKESSDDDVPTKYVKENKCEFCGKKFGRLDNLRRHKLICKLNEI